MSDYVALPQLAGILSGFVGLDREALTFESSSRTVESFQIGLLDADAAGDTIVELRTVAGGVGGEFMQLTIPAGDNVPTVTVPTGDAPITMLQGDKLFLRVLQAPPMAMGLYGVLVLNSVGTGAVINPAGAQDLTTDAIVLGYMPQASAIDQAVRDQVRLGVSQRMVSWMGRIFVHPQGPGPFYRLSPGSDSRQVLVEWPASALVVSHNGTAIDPTNFRTEGDRLLRYTGGGDSIANWPAGSIEFDGQFGYAASPEALVHAATWQTAAELRRVDLRLVGVQQHTSQAGATETLDDDGWLGSVKEAMMPFRRIA